MEHIINSIISVIDRAKTNLKHGNFFNINFSNKLLWFLKSSLKTLSSVKFSQKYKAVEIIPPSIISFQNMTFL